MAESASPDSPLEAAAGAAGPEAIAAFSLLGNEIRLSVLLALWEATEPTGENVAVSFSDLRGRVGMRDGGQLAYHLDKLADHFIRKTDDGYELRPAGRQLVRTVIAGTGIDDTTFEPVEIEPDCPLCDAPTVIHYENSMIHRLCTECEGTVGEDDNHLGVLYRGPLDPAALNERTPEQVWTAGHVKMRRLLLSLIEGVCPQCSGPTANSLDICANHVPDDVCENCGSLKRISTEVRCTVCKFGGTFALTTVAVYHPSVLAFFNERGVALQYEVGNRWKEVVEDVDQTLVSEDPPQVRVSYQYDGDRLDVLLDDELNVLEVTEPA